MSVSVSKPHGLTPAQVLVEETTSAPLVLIVEDHEDTRALLRYVVERRGLRVIEAINGEEAIASAHQTHPDMILMDTGLPGVDGITATRCIRESLSDHVPIVFLSGHAQPRIQAEALAMGGDYYLVKPVDLDQLETIVEESISKRNLISRVEPAPIV